MNSYAALLVTAVRLFYYILLKFNLKIFLMMTTVKSLNLYDYMSNPEFKIFGVLQKCKTILQDLWNILQELFMNIQ